MPKTRNSNGANNSVDSSDEELFQRIELLEKTLQNQAAKIELLESTNALKTATVEALQKQLSSLEIRMNSSEKLDARIESQEQYQRRSDLRIYGVKTAEKETAEDVVKLVEKVASQVGVDLKSEDIYRAHRIGKAKTLDNGTVVKPIIVKFRSWNARCAMYRARPTKSRPLKKLRDGEKRMFGSIGLDLTKQRADLLEEARNLLKTKFPEDENVFAYSDINCALAIRFGEKNVKFFSNRKQLNDLFKE